MNSELVLPFYVRSEKKLNWLLYSLVFWIFLSACLGNPKWVSQIVTLIGVISIIWQSLIIVWRIKNEKNEELLYNRLSVEDYWRLFFGLLSSYQYVAFFSKETFLLYSLITAPLMFMVVTISIVDVFLNKKLTPIAIGCIAFAYFLFSWQKNAFIEHYGVPIIGHILEKNNYTAIYYVNAKLENSKSKHKVLAELKVKNTTDTYEDGESRWGTPTYSTEHYKEIWINKIDLPDIGWSKVKQYEILDDENSVIIEDSNQREWFVSLTKDKVY
jgi:hypothetical protein